jgi:hypothetical protein
MKRKYLVFLGLSMLAKLTPTYAQDLKHLSSYETGTSDAAEVVAYDKESKKAVFTSSSANSFSIVNIQNPNSPVLIKEVSLVSYGGGPNSIDIHNSTIAIAIEANTKTDAGKVVFFDMDGTFLKEVTVGYLPDMLTYTPDGTKIVVANEGEPNDDYSIDPDGSVSIVDLSSGVSSASVTSVEFTDYNTKKAHLLNKGIRIFGNDGASSVSQDLEPEYITISEDGTKAFVNCQENNALAVIDLTNNTFLDILPLGFKNHKLGTPTVESYILNELVSNWPTLGTPEYNGGQPTVNLGGFSGLFYDDDASTSTDYVFYAIPDRGPNASPVAKADVSPAVTQNLRPFKLPNYQSRVVKFTLNKNTGAITLDSPILLTRKDGTTPISGKGNIPGVDEVPVAYASQGTTYENEDYTDAGNLKYHALAYDELGGDFEGILKDKNGKFWMCDEYRPAIYNFEDDGTLIERYVADGISLLGTNPMPVDTYGKETLPSLYASRRANRGFEAIAYDEINHTIYAFIQSPLYNPGSSTKNTSDVIRILGIDATDGTPVSEYVYLLERNKEDGYSSSRVDKIGDAVYQGDGKFLVIERDSEGPEAKSGKKYVYEIDITFATNILNNPIARRDADQLDPTLEEMSADEILDNDIIAVHKYKVLNLPSVGYASSDKAEGIALLPNNEIAVLNDNDFGLAGAGITDNSVLGIISFDDDYGFDASNRDETINITNHPTLGMFMPDAIASYDVDGMTYIVTANEGDSRDYDGYSEEVRVKDLTLNANYYPNAATLQNDEDLGRLKTTTANGDYDSNGEYEQIYSYGARSFSIFDQYGNLVFDSADDFGQLIANEEPTLFNEDEGELDGRSDDKGVEPEAVGIGTIDGKTYAFIGFERQSSIVVYDITDPYSPEFITFYTNRVDNNGTIEGDIAPEIIKFIKAEDSPNGQNMLLVGYEVSGTMSMIQIGDDIASISKEVMNNTFKLFPNPVNGNQNLQFNKNISGDIYDMSGKKVKTLTYTNSISVNELTEGVYVIKTKNNGTKRFLKF